MANIVKTIGTNGRDYSTISLWVNDLTNAGIYSSGDVAIGECYNDSPFNELINITGVLSTLNSIILTVPPSQRHNGTPGTGATITRNSTGTVITCNVLKQITIEWLEINLGGTDTNNVLVLGSNSLDARPTGVIAANMLIYGSTDLRIGFSDSARTLSVFNCMIFRHTSSSPTGATFAGINQSEPTSSYCNNTIFNLRRTSGTAGNIRGITAANDDATIKNNLVLDILATGNTPKCFEFAVKSSGRTNNISSDNTAASGDFTSSSLINQSSNQFISTLTGSEDLHLKYGSVAINAGANLGNFIGKAQQDINGRDRVLNYDTWDVGAHEYVRNKNQIVTWG